MQDASEGTAEPDPDPEPTHYGWTAYARPGRDQEDEGSTWEFHQDQGTFPAGLP